jgi:D-alanyl-lipoteichoic acid acyltransferase DltB (MBOAT superfamily)
VYGSLELYRGFDLLIAIFLFTIQIYCDFSGYSDIAIGTAKLLGIDLTINFKSPYFSASIKEFWSRWHISLSKWFRDYVYIPLGGNRCSRIKHYRNLIITFLLSGLWHGANWTYVILGGAYMD